MDDYLSKPVRPADLDALLARWDVDRAPQNVLTAVR
jgi:hypothetical protein